MFDYLIVGSGLFGCTFAQLAKSNGKNCLIIEKRSHPFGNCYTESLKGINVHKYGPHIFHTSNMEIWNYVNQFCSFNNYVNRPKVNYDGQIFSFPINLFTLYQLWGVKTPAEAKIKLDSVKVKINNPTNLEDWILSQVGEEIYYKFIYGYTKKQWNTEPRNLPSFIIKRLPIRLNYDDNYFNDIYQGIPIGGYTAMMEKMVEGVEILLETDYFKKRDYWDSLAKKVVYTGPIDYFYNYIYGKLAYRSLSFEHINLSVSDFQGNAIVNYTSDNTPYTRIIEHKHFEKINSEETIVTKEYPSDFKEGLDPYYPINDELNTEIFSKYKSLCKNEKFIFGGRLAQYQYFDMHQVIGSAIKKYNDLN